MVYLVYYLPTPSEMHSFCVTPYVLRYDLGFISRGLIGSFWGIFFPFISSKIIWTIICLNEILLCVLAVCFLELVRKQSDDETKNGILFLIFLFLVNPSSISFLFYWGNYGRLDLFMIIGVITCGILMVKQKGVWVIPVICVSEMMIHQGFTFSYFPCVLLLLLYNVMVNKKGKTVFVVTCVCGCIAFLYFQFGGKIEGLSMEQTLSILTSRTDWSKENMTDMVMLEYYTNILDFIQPYVITPLKKNIIKLIVTFVFLYPLEYILFFCWKAFVKETGKRWFWMFPVFIIVATFPKFILTCDYGRDLASIFLSQFFLIFTFFAMGSNAMRVAVKELQNMIMQKNFLAVVALVELAALGKFEAANILNISDNVFQVLSALLP